MAKMSANDQLQDLQTTNQHLVESYKNELAVTMLKFFKRMEKLVIKEISSFYDDTSQMDKSLLIKNIKAIQVVELNKIKSIVEGDVGKFLGIEASLYKTQLESVFAGILKDINIKDVSETSLKKTYGKTKIVMDKGETHTITSLWATFFASVQTKVRQSTDSAYTLEKSKSDYISDVVGGQKINENQLNAVIAVLIQQAYSVAIRSINTANSSLISGYLYNAVLDNRTSPICIEYSGGTWYYNFPEKSSLPYAVVPPQHYRCRSFTTPLTKSFVELGISAKDLTADQKVLLSGDTTKLGYSEWFERQPNSIKKEVLGVVRYDAYQKGGVPITSFYNNGSKLTLKQLKSKGITISEQYLRYIA